jgi:hypothetical protein
MTPYDGDDLDRALFALDLHEPPPDLRASILAATVYRTPPVIRPWEVWTSGILCALVVWLCILAAHGAGTPASTVASALGSALLAIVSHPALLFWAAAGGSAAVWLSQVNLTLAPGYRRIARR